jgi:hypothetical protein
MFATIHRIHSLTLAATRNTSPVSAFRFSAFQRFPPSNFGCGHAAA